MKNIIRNYIILAAAVMGFALAGCSNGVNVTPADLSALSLSEVQAYASAMSPAQLQTFTATLTPVQIQTVAGPLTVAQLQALAPFIVPAVTSIDGAALYSTDCAGCHGLLASSAKSGATSAAIQVAISTNTGGMGSLSSTLTVNQIQAIATALTSTAANGATLYASDCALCHGPLASTTKLGATSARIQTAIVGNTGGMGSLANSLTGSQIQAIATALTVTAPPVAPNGAALYVSDCAACHGALASSTKLGATSARIQTAIGANTGSMGSLATTLTAAQIQAIVTALVPVNGGTTGGTTTANGTTLYANDCAGCHGNLASSSKTGTTAARIQSAINGNSGGMGSLSSLSAADIQAIVTVLAGTGTGTGTGTTTTTDGATLYKSYCASCHSSLGSTSVSSIQSAIKSNKGGMGSLSLTSAQLQSISTYLAGAGGSGSEGGDD